MAKRRCEFYGFPCSQHPNKGITTQGQEYRFQRARGRRNINSIALSSFRITSSKRHYEMRSNEEASDRPFGPRQ